MEPQGCQLYQLKRAFQKQILVMPITFEDFKEAFLAAVTTVFNAHAYVFPTLSFSSGKNPGSKSVANYHFTKNPQHSYE